MLSFGSQFTYSQNKGATPIANVRIKDATKDKPQSKLWFAHQTWFALLPSDKGLQLWKRSDAGWNTNSKFNRHLKELAAQVDVFVAEDTLYVVGVADRQLDVFSIQMKGADLDDWQVNVLNRLQLPKSKDVETATIVKDNSGVLWVAALLGDEVTVLHSNNGTDWPTPVILANHIGKDDICTLVKEATGVRVIWSDQPTESVQNRFHENGKTPEDWQAVEFVEKGHKTADDHLNTAITPNGTIWLTSKNSLDELGKPQFVLRVKETDSEWKNYPYCNLQSWLHPSRPAIFSVENSNRLVLNAYTMYHSGNPHLGSIYVGVIDTTTTEILTQEIPVIQPDTSHWKPGNRINNVTGPKDPFPAQAPWIILASDNEGNIYEADLSTYFKP